MPKFKLLKRLKLRFKQQIIGRAGRLGEGSGTTSRSVCPVELAAHDDAYFSLCWIDDGRILSLRNHRVMTDLVSSDGLPDPWEAIEDTKDGTYYYNSETGESTWDRPNTSDTSDAAPTVEQRWILQHSHQEACFIRHEHSGMYLNHAHNRISCSELNATIFMKIFACHKKLLTKYGHIFDPKKQLKNNYISNNWVEISCFWYISI